MNLSPNTEVPKQLWVEYQNHRSTPGEGYVGSLSDFLQKANLEGYRFTVDEVRSLIWSLKSGRLFHRHIMLKKIDNPAYREAIRERLASL